MPFPKLNPGNTLRSIWGKIFPGRVLGAAERAGVAAPALRGFAGGRSPKALQGMSALEQNFNPPLKGLRTPADLPRLSTETQLAQVTRAEAAAPGRVPADIGEMKLDVDNPHGLSAARRETNSASAKALEKSVWGRLWPLDDWRTPFSPLRFSLPYHSAMIENELSDPKGSPMATFNMLKWPSRLWDIYSDPFKHLEALPYGLGAALGSRNLHGRGYPHDRRGWAAGRWGVHGAAAALPWTKFKFPRGWPGPLFHNDKEWTHPDPGPDAPRPPIEIAEPPPETPQLEFPPDQPGLMQPGGLKPGGLPRLTSEGAGVGGLDPVGTEVGGHAPPQPVVGGLQKVVLSQPPFGSQEYKILNAQKHILLGDLIGTGYLRDPLVKRLLFGPTGRGPEVQRWWEQDIDQVLKDAPPELRLKIRQALGQ